MREQTRQTSLDNFKTKQVARAVCTVCGGAWSAPAPGEGQAYTCPVCAKRARPWAESDVRVRRGPDGRLIVTGGPGEKKGEKRK